MQNLVNLIERFSGKHHQRLLNITAPLLQNFGINYFCYQHVSFDGAWTLVGNNPDWLMFSGENSYYRIDPSLVDPAIMQSGVCFPATHQHREFQDTLVKQASDRFDLHHALAIIEKTELGCDYYFLGAPKQHHGAINVYINHLNLLKKDFASYFRYETLPLLKNIDDHAVDLKSLKKEHYTKPSHPLSPLLEQALSSHHFLEDINVRQKIFLTPREKECLHWYRLGKTAKETARILNLSPRTVEGYLDNIKRKFGCRYKRDLLTEDL